MSGSRGAGRVVWERWGPGFERSTGPVRAAPGERVSEAAGRLVRGPPTLGLGCPCSPGPRPSIGAGPCLRKTLGGAGGKAHRQQTTLRPQAAGRFSGTPGVRLPRSRPRAPTCATLGTGLEDAYLVRFLRAALDLPISDQPSCRCSKADI